jgi:glycine dehydrogenase subunit 2
MFELQEMLKAVTGMRGVALSPLAGAHGEFAGVAMIRAYHRARGDLQRNEIIVPEAAHGTNPATATMCGCVAREVAVGPDGDVDVEALRAAVGPKTAGIMLTNPSTLGVFERRIEQVAGIVHAAGGLLYYDGANLNAILGKVRPGDMGFDVIHMNLHKTFSTPHGGGGPGSGPVAVKKALIPFLPKPRLEKSGGRWTWNYDRPQSIGRVRAFYGNIGMHVRALAYIMAHGGPGLRNATLDAVLNATYIRKLLEPYYDLPHNAPTMHECVFSDDRQAKRGVRTGDIAKRLIDYGFHPYTVSFPLIVHGAMMIEPTETESKAEMDLFVDALISIAKEVEDNPELVLKAPHNTRTSRVDEVGAARKPVVRWKSKSTANKAAD